MTILAPIFRDHLAIDLTQIHPKFRDGFEKEQAYLNTTYPLRDKVTVAFQISDKYCKKGRDCKSEAELEDMTGTGVTSSNLSKGQFAITLMEKYYGNDADMKFFDMVSAMDRKMQFHGSMTDNTFVLTHEYGHVIDGMMQRAFMFEDSDYLNRELREQYIDFVKMAIEAMEHTIDKAPIMQKIEMMVTKTLIPIRNDPNRLVSGYAMVGGPAEMYAETFAAMCWATDPTDKELPSVKALAALIKRCYEEMDKVGA